MTEITKDMLIGDILDADRGTAKYFLEMGMHCLGCPLPEARALSRPAWFTALMSIRLLPRSTSISLPSK